jgi:hypothetical protein
MGIKDIVLGKSKSTVTIGDIELTATLSESHKRSGTLTKRAVEKGSDTNDHFIKDPAFVSIEGVISDQPLPGYPGANVVSAIRDIIAGDDTPSMTAWLEFERMYDEGDIVDIDSHRGFLPDMKILTIETTLTCKTARELRFTVTAEKVNIVESAITEAIPIPEEVVAQEKKKTGKKSTKKPDEKKKSIAAQKWDGFKGAIGKLLE